MNREKDIMAINKILVLTERDLLSTKITAFAVDLAIKLGVKEIVLLHIIIPAPAQSFTTTGDFAFPNEDYLLQMNNLLWEESNQLLQQESKKASRSGISVMPLVTFHDSKTDLNHFMEETRASLIVCGSQDEHTFINKVFGTRTENLARRVDYPMIIIKEDSQISDINDIAVAIDIDTEDQSGLHKLKEFADMLNARLLFLHVLTQEERSSQDALEKLRLLARRYHISNYSINVVNNHSIENGLLNFVRKYNPDMVAVLSQGKGKIKKLIYGSHSEEIIEETDKPIFLCKIN